MKTTLKTVCAMGMVLVFAGTVRAEEPLKDAMKGMAKDAMKDAMKKEPAMEIPGDEMIPDEDVLDFSDEGMTADEMDQEGDMLIAEGKALKKRAVEMRSQEKAAKGKENGKKRDVMKEGSKKMEKMAE